MEQFSEETGQTVPRVHSGVPGTTARSRSPQWRRIVQAGVGLGVAAGVAVGAAALAGAATSGGTTPKSSSTPSTAKPGAKWAQGGHFAGRGFGGAGLGGPWARVRRIRFCCCTARRPSTVPTDTRRSSSRPGRSPRSPTYPAAPGASWSRVRTRPLSTYTVNSGSSVNGGESGIASVKSGNKVSVVAVVSKGTATVKTLMDATTLQANRGTWAPTGPGGPMSPPAAPSSGSSTS